MATAAVMGGAIAVAAVIIMDGVEVAVITRIGRAVAIAAGIELNKQFIDELARQTFEGMKE